MKFLLVCCMDETRWAKLPASERDRIMGETGELAHELSQSGHLLAGAKLESSATDVTVRRKHGQQLIVDGPFADTKEQLDGDRLVAILAFDQVVAAELRLPSLTAGGT